MITNKKLSKQIQELSDFIKSNEYEELKKDSAELKRVKELLSHVKFKVKDIKFFEEGEENQPTVRIIYELPVIDLTIDENGEPSKNDFFYSSNMLEMISLEDMNKIQDFLRKIKFTKM